MDLFEDIVACLNKVSNVPVELDTVMDAYSKKIVLSRMKLNEIVSSYNIIYALVHKCWSSLPDPPCDEKTYIFVWMFAAENYCVNHNTISWEGANPNTFVHLWSIVDRIRVALEGGRLNWVVGSRNCADYTKTTGMTGPLDQYMYSSEYVTPAEILAMDTDLIMPTYRDEKKEFCSYYDFCMDSYLRKPEVVITTSDIAAANYEVMRQRRALEDHT